MHNILCRPKSLTISNEKTIAFNSIAIGMQQLSSCKYLVKSNPQIVSLDPFLLANTRAEESSETFQTNPFRRISNKSGLEMKQASQRRRRRRLIDRSVCRQH